MATKTLIDDGTDLFVESDGDRPRGCAWDESVCTEMPEYRVAGGPDDEQTVDLYCPRHYALELARLVEVHLHECDEPVSAHVSSFGR